MYCQPFARADTGLEDIVLAILDWLHTTIPKAVPYAQTLTPIVMLTSAIFLLFQLRLNHHLAKIQQDLNRRQHYWSASIPAKEYLDAVRLHWRDHFDKQFDAIYAVDDRKRESYLLMKQKYMYLMFQNQHQDGFSHASAKWLEELVQYREFRHVHRSHFRYYPRFAEAVNKLIGTSLDDETPWMCDTYPQNLCVITTSSSQALPRASAHSGALAKTGVANCFWGGGFTIPYKTGCFVLCTYKCQIYRVDYSL